MQAQSGVEKRTLPPVLSVSSPTMSRLTPHRMPAARDVSGALRLRRCPQTHSRRPRAPTRSVSPPVELWHFAGIK